MIDAVLPRILIDFKLTLFSYILKISRYPNNLGQLFVTFAGNFLN